MSIKYLAVMFAGVFQIFTAYSQEIGLSSNCGLFSPYQVDFSDYMKFEHYSKYPGMDLEITNLHDKKELEVSMLINLFSPGNNVERKPMNLCFALDRSASMEENNRMEKLKTALKQILSLLTSDDYISIVVYDDNAQVVLPSRQYNSAQDSVFIEIIDRITIGGGTNMMAGMLKGYSEVSKNASTFRKNRLILMSDGVSTTGEKDPVRILNHSINYLEKGIETSTIGLGKNINFELLHLISVEGKGTSYFVGDCDSAYLDIGYVLRDELFSMNANMENINIEISYPKYFKSVNVYGASKVINDKTLTVYTSNLLHQSQFILVKFRTKRENKKHLITVNLNFTENGIEKNIVNEVTYVKNELPSSKMILANKIIDAVNCVRNRLVNHVYNLDCLEQFASEPNAPDNIVMLKKMVK
ncbi:MAG: VWA domain-containing protein [Prevotellaceae bacterium]|jgi:hypothetical protein|nr:VWA domain-containing protein [Prevotellaceae bacterium]